jgi:hypothetical protein
MGKIIQADELHGQTMVFNGSGYHGTAGVYTSPNQLYFGSFGMTPSVNNNYYYPYGSLVIPCDCVVEKIILKNIAYASYTTGPSASGNGRILLNKYDSAMAPMDYDQQLAYTAAANVSLTFTPNVAYSAGDSIKVFWTADGAWRYMSWSVLIKQT